MKIKIETPAAFCKLFKLTINEDVDYDDGLVTVTNFIDFSGNEKLKVLFNELFPNYIDFFIHGDVAVSKFSFEIGG